MLALAASVSGAFAWDLTVSDAYIGGTNIMIVPPVVSTASLAQIPVRATRVVVAAGSPYRIGSQIIVAAHSGAITNSTVTTTGYYTNGYPVSLAVAQWSATNGVSVFTNTCISVAPITVPAVGLSGYDGTVRWYRARTADIDDIRLQLAVAGGVLTLTDSSGSTLDYTAAGTVDFSDFPGALYVHKSATNACSVKAMGW